MEAASRARWGAQGSASRARARFLSADGCAHPWRYVLCEALHAFVHARFGQVAAVDDGLRRFVASEDTVLGVTGDGFVPGPVFSTPAEGHAGLAHAQQEKPKVPLHVLSTAELPIIRFIGHIDKTINTRYFAPWIECLKLWISQGKTPFLFVHTADNRESPEMARHLYHTLQQHIALPELDPFADEKQSQLF